MFGLNEVEENKPQDKILDDVIKNFEGQYYDDETKTATIQNKNQNDDSFKITYFDVFSSFTESNDKNLVEIADKFFDEATTKNLPDDVRKEVLNQLSSLESPFSPILEKFLKLIINQYSGDLNQAIDPVAGAIFFSALHYYSRYQLVNDAKKYLELEKGQKANAKQ